MRPSRWAASRRGTLRRRQWTQTYDTAYKGTGKILTPTSGVKVTDGNSGNNYNYTYTAAGVGIINGASVTITNVTAANKTYDGTTTATLSGGAVSGAVSGDTVTFTAGSGTFGSRNVGSQTVTASGYALTTSGISTKLQFERPAVGAQCHHQHDEPDDHGAGEHEDV